MKREVRGATLISLVSRLVTMPCESGGASLQDHLNGRHVDVQRQSSHTMLTGNAISRFARTINGLEPLPIAIALDRVDDPFPATRYCVLAKGNDAHRRV